MADWQYPRSSLMVFCKAPEKGKVKTRLMNDLIQQALDGEVIATKVHEYLALHIIALAVKARLAPVELWCSPDTTNPFFQQCKNTFDVTLRDQVQGDLGDRMSNAFNETLKDHSSAIIIGTDCPVYNVKLLRKAFELLEQAECSVIAPAEDGGYPLLGLCEPKDAIFRDMFWGNENVFSETVNRLSGKVEILDTLWDVDRLQDLVRLTNESRTLGLDKEFIDYLDSLKMVPG